MVETICYEFLNKVTEKSTTHIKLLAVLTVGYFISSMF